MDEDKEFWEKIDREMEESIARYERAKENGTLDEEFPVIGTIKET